MRKIEFRKSTIPRDTKIFVGENELISKFDADAIRVFRLNRQKLTPMFQKNILRDFQRKLQQEATEMTPQEITFIVDELNDRLDGKIV